MVTMEHPNRCVHEVRDDLVSKFLEAGWNIKAAPCEPPVVPEGPKKRRPRKGANDKEV